MYSLLCLGRLLESLCFALLPHVFDCLKEKHGPMVICVSPLTSLMMDQTENFSRTSLQMEFVGEAQRDPNAIRRGFYYSRLVRE